MAWTCTAPPLPRCLACKRTKCRHEQRRYAKVINFGLIYGMSAYGLARNLGIDNTAAKNYIERYFARYPGVKHYMDNTKLEAKAKGYVETVFGRRLYLPEINSPNGPRRAGAERAAINAPMQGTAADLIKLSMVKVQQVLDAEKRGTKMIMQVHDELVFEVPENEVDWLKHEIPRLMAGVAQLKVPLLAEVGVGENWEKGALTFRSKHEKEKGESQRVTMPIHCTPEVLSAVCGYLRSQKPPHKPHVSKSSPKA